MSHKIDVESLTVQEKWAIAKVESAKGDIKRAAERYSQALRDADQVTHHKKIAHYTRQSEGAVRLQMQAVRKGQTVRPQG